MVQASALVIQSVTDAMVHLIKSTTRARRQQLHWRPWLNFLFRLYLIATYGSETESEAGECFPL